MSKQTNHPQSNCCQATMMVNIGTEGTGAYICSKCKKGCDPYHPPEGKCCEVCLKHCYKENCPNKTLRVTVKCEGVCLHDCHHPPERNVLTDITPERLSELRRGGAMINEIGTPHVGPMEGHRVDLETGEDWNKEKPYSSVAQPRDWISEFDNQFVGPVLFFQIPEGSLPARIKAFIAKVEAEAFERGRRMKGSSFREGYDRGRLDELEKRTKELEELRQQINHESQKFLDGFGHPKDCGECNKDVL